MCLFTSPSIPHGTTRSYLCREVVEGFLLRNGSRFPERPDGLAYLAEAQLAVFVLQDGPVVSREPHERANGGLWQAGVFLAARLFSKLALVRVAAAAVGGGGVRVGRVTTMASAFNRTCRPAVLCEALRVEVREQAVVPGSLGGKGAPQSGYLLTDIFGSGGGPVDASLDRVSMLRVEEHEWRQPPRRSLHRASCNVAMKTLEVEGLSRASLVFLGVATQALSAETLSSGCSKRQLPFSRRGHFRRVHRVDPPQNQTHALVPSAGGGEGVATEGAGGSVAIRWCSLRSSGMTCERSQCSALSLGCCSYYLGQKLFNHVVLTV